MAGTVEYFDPMGGCKDRGKYNATLFSTFWGEAVGLFGKLQSVTTNARSSTAWKLSFRDSMYWQNTVQSSSSVNTSTRYQQLFGNGTSATFVLKYLCDRLMLRHSVMEIVNSDSYTEEFLKNFVLYWKLLLRSVFL